MEFINVKELSTLEDIQRAYEKLDQREDLVNKQLEACVARQYALESKLKNITKAIPKLHEVYTDAEKLADMVQHTATLAENVSEKVRRLDMTRSRVSECQQRVHDLVDLQHCSEGIRAALVDEDYEKAAGHVHRFLSIDQKLVKQTADDVAEDRNSVNDTFIHLQNATKNLSALVAEKFNKAVKEKDYASVERFFKLYPLLNLHEEGLRKYTLYLGTKLRETCKANLRTALSTIAADKSKKPNMIFAETMTLLLEGAARVIDTHQTLVDNYYGTGKLCIMVSYLLKECDDLSTEIFDQFIEHRELNKKANLIKNADDNSKLDPKALDVLLGEITLIHSKIELFFQFIRKRVTSGIDSSNELKESELQKVNEIIKSSQLNQKKEYIVNYFYVLLETYFMEESVQKAISIDKVEAGAQVTSLVDDVFFIVSKSLRRACSSSSLNAVFLVLTDVSRVLKNKYCQVLKKQLCQGYTTGYLDLAQAYNAFHQAHMKVSDPEQAKMNFLLYLNNADISLENIDTLRNTVNDEIERAFPNISDSDREKYTTSLAGLTSVTMKLTNLIELGMKNLRDSVITPRVGPWFKSFSTSHQITENNFVSFEANETFVHQLISNIDILLSSFKHKLTPKNYILLVNNLTMEITQYLEKILLQNSSQQPLFTRLGGLIFDKEIRALIGYLTNATSWSVRDKFTRLTQMSALLNLESLSEYPEWRSSVAEKKLKKSELETILMRRIDFKKEEIKNLNLD